MKHEFWIARTGGLGGPYEKLIDAEAQAKVIVERNGGEARVVLVLVTLKASVQRTEGEAYAGLANGQEPPQAVPMIFAGPPPADPALQQREIAGSAR